MGYMVSRDDGWRMPDWLWRRSLRREAVAQRQEEVTVPVMVGRSTRKMFDLESLSH